MKKIIDIEDRIPTLRERRRKRTNIKFMILSFLFLFFLLILVYFQSPYSDVKRIEISGATLTGEDYYRQKSTIKVGHSMWSFNATDVEKKLEKFEWVKKVTIKRKWLTSVEINIEEWEKVAYTEEKGVFYPILENGYVFSQAASKDGLLDVPVFMEFKNKKVRQRLVKELAKLDPEVLTLISQINANPTKSDPYTIRLYMNDGYEVRAVISTLVDKLNYYPSIVAQIPKGQKGIIDLEVGSYYRPYDEEYKDINLGMEQSKDVEAEQEVTNNNEATTEQ